MPSLKMLQNHVSSKRSPRTVEMILRVILLFSGEKEGANRLRWACNHELLIWKPPKLRLNPGSASPADSYPGAEDTGATCSRVYPYKILVQKALQIQRKSREARIRVILCGGRIQTFDSFYVTLLT